MSHPYPGTMAARHYEARQRHEALFGPPWYRAPLPRRWHRCTPWTTRSTQNLPSVERCACGAIRFGEDHPWTERNSRRRH